MTNPKNAVARAALDLDGLETVAKQATPGPWQVYEQHLVDKQQAIQEFERLIDGQEGEFWPVLPMLTDGKVCPAVTGCGPKSAANAGFIAAFNPAVALALVTELRALRAERGWITCSERMPSANERVLVWYMGFGGARVVVAMRETEAENGEDNGWRQAGGEWLPASAVTEWMPLPQPPGVER